jgi:uncharacterized membrane protein SirB2
MREVMLIVHFIGLAMGLGTGFANAFLGSTLSTMTPEEAIKFKLRTLVLGKMGHVGIGLLIISGFYMITPFWKVLPEMPWLIAKLSLVIVLIVLIGIISVTTKKARKGDASQFKKLATLGKLTLLTAVAIVVCAVMSFR